MNVLNRPLGLHVGVEEHQAGAVLVYLPRLNEPDRAAMLAEANRQLPALLADQARVVVFAAGDDPAAPRLTLWAIHLDPHSGAADYTLAPDPATSDEGPEQWIHRNPAGHLSHSPI